MKFILRPLLRALIPLSLVTLVLSRSSAIGLTCEGVFAARNSSPAARELRAPEIEAKLRPQHPETLVDMQRMEGESWRIPKPDGSSYRFDINSAGRHLYIDTFYDIIDEKGKLLLFEQGALLRRRERWDWDSRREKWIFKKIVFHAKNGGIDDPLLIEAVMARNEIRGQESKNRKKMKNKTAEILLDGEDQAVAYARSLVGPNGKFIPVMKSKSDRVFLYAQPKREDANVPGFTITLDQIRHRGLIREKRKGYEQAVEIEMAGDSRGDSPAVAEEKSRILNHITERLALRFDLETVREAKYQSGARQAIFGEEASP